MARTRPRLDQIKATKDPDDLLTPAEVQNIESTAVTDQDFLKGVLTQVQRVIHGLVAGDWKDDPSTVFGGDASLRALFERGGDLQQQGLLDNNTDFIVVGSTTTDTLITVYYVFKLPIANRARTGTFTIIVDGLSAELGDDYWYVAPEITGVAFSSSVVGTDVRLNIVTSSVGENPVLYYRVVKTP